MGWKEYNIYGEGKTIKSMNNQDSLDDKVNK
jgi:hypothetical protein